MNKLAESNLLEIVLKRISSSFDGKKPMQFTLKLFLSHKGNMISQLYNENPQYFWVFIRPR